MEEIKKLKDKIKRDKKYLVELKNRKFNKNQDFCARDENRKYKKVRWLAIKDIIRAEISLVNSKGKRIIFRKLAKKIGTSNKTAKRYYLLVLGNKELQYKYNSNSSWNSQAKLRERVIAKLVQVIKRLDYHM